jgi:hypothetical protein
MIMSFFDRLKKLLGASPTPPQPSRMRQALEDTFVEAPDALAGAIANAGGNQNRVVRWFDTQRSPVYRFSVPGKGAIEAWQSLRQAMPAAGYWPVVLGDEESVQILSEGLAAITEPSYDVAQALRKAEVFNLARWRASYGIDGDTCVTDEDRKERRGSWDDARNAEPQTRFTAHTTSWSGKPHPHVWMGLIPAAHSWEVPAIVGFGHWNACPEPHIHAGLHRRWLNDFGAELVCMRFDVLEFQVARPPATREAAYDLAELQYEYCDDIVSQGCETVRSLANSLLNGRIWYFWWD